MNDQGMLDKGKANARRSEASAGMDEGLRVLSYLISGVLFYGGLGWVADHFLGTGFLLPIGIVAGAAFGVYIIIRRFGQVPAPEAQTTSRADDRKTDKTEGAL
ncbi:MAG TPA: hypothetical protein VIT20_07480 [Propionibacteriaceae bacterium]